ncbi:phosphotransferase [Candidatus Poribacteria bacterium]|nr:phosphotransferase [Candidatus Poribacteria bacterium]
MPFDLPYIIQQIASQFGTVSDCVQMTPILHGVLERNNVWRLEIAGKTYLLKQHLNAQPIGESTFTPFQIESSALAMLHQAGCHVPKIVWKSDPALCLLLEWCGEATLDELAQLKQCKHPGFIQAQLTEILKPVSINVIREFCRIENAFAKHTDAIAPYVYPLDYSDFLHRTMQTMLDQGRQTMSYLARLSGLQRQETIDTIWLDLSDRLHGTAPTLGSLDYNARNVMINQEKPTFIDFASVGWDWGERRLVQSLNSIGANCKGGNFVSLLDSEIVGIYASEASNYRKNCSKSEITVRVDYHHLLFYLIAIYQLVSAIARPNTAENQAFLKAWGDAKARLSRAVNLLADSRLSDHPYALRLRELIAEFREGLKIG